MEVLVCSGTGLVRLLGLIYYLLLPSDGGFKRGEDEGGLELLGDEPFQRSSRQLIHACPRLHVVNEVWGSAINSYRILVLFAEDLVTSFYRSLPRYASQKQFVRGSI